MGRAKLTPREESLKPIISSNIKKYLEEQGKKPADLQRGTSIAQSTISDYTSGKTLASPGNIEKIASFFGVMKSDIDPRFSDEWVSENEFPIIEETVKTMKKLDETRQKVVLSAAQDQHEEQEAERKAKVPIPLHLDDEAIYGHIDRAAAWQGEELTEEDRDAIMIALKKHLEEKAKEESEKGK